MSSTYSTNLALELIGTGDQAGNWGSTTNTNIGILLEQAISGYVTQSMPGTDVTLSMTQGASATARNMYIELTGTGGASLIVPINNKLYFVYNNTSAATTVKVSGQTGVSVPAGRKVSLVCNGTDVVLATDYMVSPVFTGTPTAPTASAGTNTQQIATTAFVTTGLQAAYPVGSIYMSTVATNPATLFGFGTWVAYGTGRMPISADGSTYVAGATGGSATTTISSSNLPSHTHSFSATTGGMSANTSHQHYVGSNDSTAEYGGDAGNREFVQNYNAGNGPATYTNYADISHTHDVSGTTGSTGSGTAATTISPYIAVYMWNRTV
jgi:microcystin-dependent protein